MLYFPSKNADCSKSRNGRWMKSEKQSEGHSGRYLSISEAGNLVLEPLLPPRLLGCLEDDSREDALLVVSTPQQKSTWISYSRPQPLHYYSQYQSVQFHIIICMKFPFDGCTSTYISIFLVTQPSTMNFKRHLSCCWPLAGYQPPFSMISPMIQRHLLCIFETSFMFPRQQFHDSFDYFCTFKYTHSPAQNQAHIPIHVIWE